jgi:hypothetical protein
MTFWDFYADHEVLGTFALLIAIWAVSIAGEIVSNILRAWIAVRLGAADGSKYGQQNGTTS